MATVFIRAFCHRITPPNAIAHPPQEWHFEFDYHFGPDADWVADLLRYLLTGISV
jgi:hypothetical protein